MIGMVLAFLAGLPTPQDTATLDAPVYANEAYGVSLPRPFPDWVFEPGAGPQTTTVIFHPRAALLSEQLWGALVLTTFPGQVPLRQVVESRVETTWRRRLGRTFALAASDSLAVSGLPAIRTRMSGVIDHVVLDVDEYAIARGGDLIVLQLRCPGGLPRDSIEAGYQRVIAGLRIRGGSPIGPSPPPAVAESVASAEVVPPSGWRATAFDALVRYDPQVVRADFAVTVDLVNQGASPAESVAVWVWPAFVVDSIRGDSTLLPSRSFGSVSWVRLPGAIQPQGNTTVTVHYHASGTDHLPPRLMQLATRGAFAAIDWLPRVQPALDSAFQFVRTARPRVTLSFDLPDGWRAVAPGRLTADGASLGRRHMTWSVDQIATTGAAFALGPYRVVARPEGGVGVSVWLNEEDSPSRAAVDSLAAEVRTAWLFCSRAFGRLPLDEVNVAVTGTPDVRGFAGLLLVGHPYGFAVDSANAEFVPAPAEVARELARTWWGNSVAAAGPGSAWVSEALPEWTRAAFRAVTEGDSARQRVIRLADSAWHSLPGGMDVPLSRVPVADSSGELLRSKGVVALEAAHQGAGDALFREALLTLAVQHRNDWIELADVLAALGGSAAAALRTFLY
jgi:hypothetical protein